MIEKIVKLVFEKARQTAFNKTKAGLSKEVAIKTNISPRTLERIYSKYIEKLDIKTQPENQTINLLCNYLGYENYADFVKNHQNNTEKHQKITPNHNTEKVTKVEITNFDKLHKSNKLLLISSVLIILFGWFLYANYITEKDSPKFTINNFNRNTNYYYYTNPLGEIELTENPNSTNAKPLTLPILNTYLKEKNIDTSQQKVKLIKAQYFNKGWKEKPLREVKPTANQTKPKIDKPTGKKAIPKPQKTIKTLKIQLNDNALFSKISNKLAASYKITNTGDAKYLFKGNVSYSIKKSTLTKGRYVCNATLNYTIATKDNQIINSNTILSKGTGFSKETAKQNAIFKLKI